MPVWITSPHQNVVAARQEAADDSSAKHLAKTAAEN